MKLCCLQNGLASSGCISPAHLGTDNNYEVLQNRYEKMKDHVDFYFDASVDKVKKLKTVMQFFVGDEALRGLYCIISIRRDEAEVTGWRRYVQEA